MVKLNNLIGLYVIYDQSVIMTFGPKPVYWTVKDVYLDCDVINSQSDCSLHSCLAKAKESKSRWSLSLFWGKIENDLTFYVCY